MQTMKWSTQIAVGVALRVGLAVAALLVTARGANAQRYGTLAPSTLSCTRGSMALGDAVLPNCTDSHTEYLDSVEYYVSAYCEGICSETLIAITPLPFNIGLNNGPCTVPVAYSFYGAVYPASGGSLPYIGGTLTGISQYGRARINSSTDCDGELTDTGDWGAQLPC
jgi:hypothetical protein